ncbi:unnamed protein product [Rotaria sordida]|uniref:Uncharacterized protein n=1 Tax=Rotaria sordida TaxID=392033 RepID=A0A820F4E8_9BILA|nr:unnamed protein product [Rotaria sordida]
MIFFLVCLGDSRTDICLTDSVRSENSESKSKSTSIRSVLYYLCSTHSDCQSLEEYLGIDKFDVGEPSEEFKNLIKQFTRESKPENKESQEFDNIPGDSRSVGFRRIQIIASVSCRIFVGIP